MIDRFQGILFSMLFLLISSFLVSVLIGFLYMMNWLVGIFELIYVISGCIIFALAGCLFTQIVKQQIFLSSLITMLVYFLIVYLVSQNSITEQGVLFIKCLIFCISSKVIQKIKRN